jgi:ABC-type dipeptide/oligopeptide/nickel transport system permease component
LNLDQPFHVRFLTYLANLLQGDLGVSLINGRPVAEIIVHRFINTLLLTCLSTTLAVVVGFSLGAWSALHHKGLIDMAVIVLTALCLAIPSFGIAIFLTQIFSVHLKLLPVVGGGSLKHFILPCLSLAIPTAAVITRLVRARMLDEINKQYTLTARAKGLSNKQVWLRHIFPNPAVTMVGVQFGHLLGGAFVVETLFAWPGLGRLTVQAIFDQDYPVVLAAVILSALIFQVLNSMVDILHRQLDPLIREGD